VNIEQGINSRRENDKKIECQQWFQKLIQADQYVGDIYSINYETARVIIHDFYREKVGGIPSLSFSLQQELTQEKQTLILKRKMLHLFFCE